MRGTDAAEGSMPETADDGEPPLVSAHRTSPGRTVFTEEDNSEAWIATDLVVDVDG